MSSDLRQSNDIEGQWDAIVSRLPGAHVLQTWEWGQFKSRYGWEPLHRTWKDERDNVVAAALILRRAIPLRGFSARLNVMYAPKGPLLDWGDHGLRRRVLADLKDLAKQQGAIFIKIDPDVRLGSGIPGDENAQEDPLGQAVITDLAERKWHISDEQIQFRNTVVIALDVDPEVLLSNMKQKTRYNIRLAGRKGVVVRKGLIADLDSLYQMYAETSIRDGFVIRDEDYYKSVWSTFMNAGMAEPLIAEVAGEAVAGVFVFRFAGKAWYLFGMSRVAHREKMPSYLLQWEAMQRAREADCQIYDLWGAPDVFDENDPMWGVYRFKSGLGGLVVRYIGAWDLPVKPVYYRLYTQILPRILDIMRMRGRTRTRQMVD